MLKLLAQRGVGLIELMIGLTIAAVLFALAAPNFSNFIQNSKIRNAAEAIQNGLTFARGEAVRRNTNVQFVLAANGASWTVACDVALADNDGDGLPDCPGSTPVATTPSYIENRTDAEGATNVVVATSEVFSNGSASGTPLFTSTLSFNGLGRITSTTLTLGNNAVFNVSPSTGTCVAAGGSARCLRVVATSAGQIRMCDPNLTITKSTDPQAC